MKQFVGILIALVSIVTLMDAQSPSGLQAQSPPSLQPHVLLSWNAAAGVSFFKVYRSSPDTANFQWIAVSPYRQFEDPAVMPGVLYHYAVTAVMMKDSILLESTRSNIATVRAYALPAGPKGIVAGKVTDQISGLPIPRVILRFFKLPSPESRGLDITTSSTGTFSAVLDTGVYILRAEEPVLANMQSGHQAQWYLHASGPADATPLKVQAGDTTRIDFALPPNSPQLYAYVSGVVADEQGAPIAGAVVAFVRPIQELVASAAITASPAGTGSEAVDIPGLGFSRGVIWFGYTNASGKFFAQVLINRQYVAMAAKSGYYPECFNNAPDPTQATVLGVHADTTGINFSLTRKTPANTGTMQGTVVSPDGNDVPARIILFPRPKDGTDRPAVFSFTDSTGVFAFEEIEQGSYSVLAVPYGDYAPSFSTSAGITALTWLNADSVIVNGATAHVTITVPPLQNAGLTRVSGRVLAAPGTPLPGVRILARTADGRVTGYGLTDLTGRYAVEALGGGPVTLIADRFGFNFGQAPVNIPANTFSLENVDFVLSASFPTSADGQDLTPLQTSLTQNYPNPFNPTTTVRFTIGGVVAPSASEGGPAAALVRLSVYDMLGREVAVLVNARVEAGIHTATWNASGMPSGVYLYRVTTGVFTETRKMVLLK